MKKLSIFLFALIAFPTSAMAGFFSYDSYNECVLGEVKKLSDAKLANVARAYCREKFPEPRPPKFCRLLYNNIGFQFTIPDSLNLQNYNRVRIDKDAYTAGNIELLIPKGKTENQIALIIERQLDELDSLCER